MKEKKKYQKNGGKKGELDHLSSRCRTCSFYQALCVRSNIFPDEGGEQNAAGAMSYA